MVSFHRTPPPVLHLFLLTLQLKGKLGNIYSMGESVEDAYQRYIAGMVSRKENPKEIEFVSGDFANPHAAAPQKLRHR